ncbi:hypothetical protein HKD37_08G022033 [Glycine soja]
MQDKVKIDVNNGPNLKRRKRPQGIPSEKRHNSLSFVVLADMHEIEDELHKLEVENRKREVFKCLYLNEFEKVKMFFNSHDSEFRVASLPYMLEFKVMPEGCDGINEDVDDGHYDIHKMEDEMLYREFVEKLQQKESNYVFFLIDTKTSSSDDDRCAKCSV